LEENGPDNMSPNFNVLYNLRSSKFDLSRLPNKGMPETSDLDAELGKKQRYGDVPIYPKQYESFNANICEDDSDYAMD
jgi:hypothetical protein